MHYNWAWIQHHQLQNNILSLKRTQKRCSLFYVLLFFITINNNTNKQVQNEKAPNQNKNYKKYAPSGLIFKFWLFSNSYWVNPIIHNFVPARCCGNYEQAKHGIKRIVKIFILVQPSASVVYSVLHSFYWWIAYMAWYRICITVEKCSFEIVHAYDTKK